MPMRFDNLSEIDNFLQNLHKEIHAMDRATSKKKLNQQLTTLQKRKHQAQAGSLVNSTKHFTVEIKPILFQKIKAERILPNTALSHNKNFQLTKTSSI